ncbi:MAG: bifunctional N-acetylglucosamine-1-phosphate uridyltransferase/glucosamine-1-phosphate acetyltransferase [Pseudoramibacter sp.]
MEKMKQTKAIILAAGKGTRMRSQMAKVLHPLCGKALVDHVIGANRAAGISDVAVVVGYQADAVRAHLPGDVQVFEQKEQLGTGHAVMQALPFIENFDGNVLILVGDAPLIRGETLKGLAEVHEGGGYAATVLTANFDNPTGYGRIVKNGDALIKIVEEKDATEAEKRIHEINSGMYCFDAKALCQALSKMTNDNAQHEYYLTDSIEILRNLGKKVGSFPTPDYRDIVAVNSKAQLAEAGAIMRERINQKWMDAGALIVDPKRTYLSCDTTVGQDAVIYPGVITEGTVHIGKGAVVYPSVIINRDIGDGEHVKGYQVIQ